MSNICRSKIRIEQSREQPIDILVKILMIFNGEFAYDKNIEKEIQEPYIIFQKLGLKDLIELSEGIIVYKLFEKKNIFYILKEQKKFEENYLYKQYWEELYLLLKDKIEEEEAKQKSKIRKSDLDKDVEEEIQAMFDKKKYVELVELEKDINNTISVHDFKIDVEYWENILKKLQLKKVN